MTATTARASDLGEARPALSRFARVWRSLRMRDALLVSLLPVAAMIWLVGSSLATYRRARDFDDWYSRSVSVESAFRDRLHAMLALPSVVGLRQRLDQSGDDPAIIRLGVPGPAWDSLVWTGAPDWAVWYDATLEYGGTNIPVRVRKRGDTSVHWLTEKPSITIRTPRDQFYKQYRSFGLSSKDVLASYTVNRLALSFGIMASHTEIVPLFLNNRFQGVYRFVEPVDESFLRPFDRMPGNIFRGDRSERGEYMKGQPRSLFDNPYLWDRPAVNDRWTSAGPGQLRLLLEDLAGRRFEDARRMMARFDTAEVARLAAYLLVAGDPYHMDELHNEMLYEDPSTQQLHPIPWDIRLLPLDGPAQPINRLLAAWLRDPFVVDAVNRHLAAAVRPGGIRRIVDSLAGGADQRFGAYFEYDRQRGPVVGEVGTADAVRAGFEHNLAVIERLLTDDTVAVSVTYRGGEAIVDMETRGWVGADFVAFMSPGAGGVRVWMDANRSGTRDAGDPELRLANERGGRYPFTVPPALYAGWSTTRGVRAGHVPYRFFVTGLVAGAPLTAELTNRATGRSAETVTWPAGESIRPATAWHPWAYERPPSRVHRLSGTVRLAETLRIPAIDTLIIEPGTTVRLAPEVSIVSRGLVLARGTAQRPIRIIQDVPGQAWGTFSLQGHGSDSSLIQHTEITGGGGAIVDRIEYIGMVNVHRAVGVVFDHVFFHDNLRSDDTFHALHATVDITNSHFLRANGDAIDYDISGGNLIGNLIETSVNDGMDLMTSTPFVADNLITGSLDKGISVGEASRPIIFNNRIWRCVRGIEAKDRSEPLILNNDIDSNGVGLRERRKNWRYGGGPWSTIVLTNFRQSGISHDPFSRMSVWGTAGVDSVEESTPSPGSMDWLYARLGIRVDSVRRGRVARWERVTPVMPVDSARFTDDFASASDDWAGSGGVTRIDKRSAAMVIEIERITGTVSRDVSWDLPAGGLVVVEVAGRDLSGGQLVAVSDQGESVQPLDISPQEFAYRFVQLRLPPGRYRSLRLEAAPRPGLSHSVQRTTGLSVLRAGRLFLRSYAVYPVAAERTAMAAARP